MFIHASEINTSQQASLSFPSVVASGSMFNITVEGTSSPAVTNIFTLVLPPGIVFEGTTGLSSTFNLTTPSVGSDGPVIGVSIVPEATFTGTIQAEATAPPGSTFLVTDQLKAVRACNVVPTEASVIGTGVVD
jgi:hypothetical protein